MAKTTLSKKGFGFILAIFSAITWGTNGTFCALLSDLGLTTMNIAILAPAFNFGFFFLLLLFTHRAGFIVSRKMLLILMADGALSGIVNFSFVKSVTYFPVGIVSTLVYCNVFVIMIMSRIFFLDRITGRKIFAGLVSLVGVAMVIDIFGQDFNLNYLGLFWILCSILSWSGMITFERYLLMHGVSGPTILMYNGFFAILLLSISSPPTDLLGNIAQISGLSGGLGLLILLGYGLIPQVISYYLYLTGLKYIEPSYVQVAFSLDPVTASILGFLVFGQTLKTTQILGILLIIAVVGYVQLKENQEGIAENRLLAEAAEEAAV